MIAPSLLLGLLGLAVAGPLPPVHLSERAKATDSSKGFRLVLNVTDSSRDFENPIQGYFISSIHTGAGTALVGVNRNEETGRIFYQNGTEEEYSGSQATTVTDGGTPLFPAGLQLVQNGSVAVATLDNGPGTPGVQVSALKQFTYLLPETFYACNESLSYYGGKYFVVIKQTNLIKNVPEECAPVRLIPECATLNDLPEGSYSSHEFALKTKCYIDVTSVDWSE